ncbi:MAG: hypothetical protein FWG94_12580, partial [Oscillospiraceae bacterium]|nr:hypothetical protein [Oscillospiraceae bacterium]
MQQPQPPVLPPEPENPRGNLIAVVLAAALLIGGVVGGYFLIFHKPAATQDEIIAPESVSANASENASANDEIANLLHMDDALKNAILTMQDADRAAPLGNNDFSPDKIADSIAEDIISQLGLGADTKDEFIPVAKDWLKQFDFDILDYSGDPETGTGAVNLQVKQRVVVDRGYLRDLLKRLADEYPGGPAAFAGIDPKIAEGCTSRHALEMFKTPDTYGFTSRKPETVTVQM